MEINCQFQPLGQSFLEAVMPKWKLFISFAKHLCRVLLFLITFYGGVCSLQSIVRPPMPREMNLIVVEGEGQSMNIGERALKPPLARTEDENHHPDGGAAVTFTSSHRRRNRRFRQRLENNYRIYRQPQGNASAKGLKVNQVPGKLPIYINASYRGLTAKATITAFITAPPGAKTGGGGGGHGKIIAILAIVGAAAAGGAYYATHSGGSSASVPPPVPPPTPIGITPGTGTIGGAH